MLTWPNFLPQLLDVSAWYDEESSCHIADALAAPVDMVFSNPSDYSGLAHLAGGHSLFHSNFLRLFRLLPLGVGHRKDAGILKFTDQLHTSAQHRRQHYRFLAAMAHFAVEFG